MKFWLIPIRPDKKAASVSKGRFAFSGFNFYSPALAHGLVVNPVGAAAAGAGTSVGGFCPVSIHYCPCRMAFETDLRENRPVFFKGSRRTSQGFREKSEGFSKKSEGFREKFQGISEKSEVFSKKFQGFREKFQGFREKSEGFREKCQGFGGTSKGKQESWAHWHRASG